MALDPVGVLNRIGVELGRPTKKEVETRERLMKYEGRGFSVVRMHPTALSSKELLRERVDALMDEGEDEDEGPPTVS